MNKTLLAIAMLLVTLTVTAQTYNNPRQKTNDKRIKVIKVERKSNSTVLYLKYTLPEGSKDRSRIVAYPTLTDEATGKRYQATDALNFKWGTLYSGNATYKIEFPPLPKNTSVVTFRETTKVKNPWIVSNIALPIQSNSTTTNKPAVNKPAANRPAANRPAANRPAVYDKKKLLAEGYKFSWNSPSQSIINRNFKVTKVIRSNTNTIVHLQYIGKNEIKLGLYALSCALIDYDTEKEWEAKEPLNFNAGGPYSGPFTFKIEYPAIPLSVSTLAIKVNYKTVVEDIRVPIRTR